jgi:hypothetical protein
VEVSESDPTIDVPEVSDTPDPTEDAVESSESDPTIDVPEVSDTPDPASIIKQAKEAKNAKGGKP